MRLKCANINPLMGKTPAVYINCELENKMDIKTILWTPIPDLPPINWATEKWKFWQNNYPKEDDFAMKKTKFTEE